MRTLAPENKQANRAAEAELRYQKLQDYEMLKSEGRTSKAAAKLVGVSQASLSRWRSAYTERGYEGLLPDTHKRGRKSELEKLGLTPEDPEVLRIRGINLDTKSTTGSCRIFAKSEECPEDLANAILAPKRTKHNIPPSIRRAVTPSPAERLAHEGPRALALRGMWQPRHCNDILPGDIFVSDDTTPIWAWWVPWVKNSEYPYGVKLLQGQFLPVIDVASQMALTYTLIARDKGSYRAADIWSLFAHTNDTVGMPRLGWQLERGSWEANLIRGENVTIEDDELSYEMRVGGLRQLPTNVTDWHRETHGEDFPFPKTLQTWTSYLPKTKSVEGFFRRNQPLEGTLWGSLGNDQMRRPYEKAVKQFQKCQRGAADPREYFLSGEEIARRINGILTYINDEPMEGEVFHGTPRIKWDNAVADYPLLKMGDDKAWIYRSHWRVVTITQGHARVRLTHPATGRRYSLFYEAPREFAEIEGRKVLCYYDLENYEKPAHIVDPASGEFITTATFNNRVGSFLQGDASAHEVRREWKNAVMQIYGTVAKYAPSRQEPEEVAERRKALRREKRQDVRTQDSRPRRAPKKISPGRLNKDRAKELEAEAEQARKLMELAGE